MAAAGVSGNGATSLAKMGASDLKMLGLAPATCTVADVLAAVAGAREPHPAGLSRCLQKDAVGNRLQNAYTHACDLLHRDVAPMTCLCLNRAVTEIAREQARVAPAAPPGPGRIDVAAWERALETNVRRDAAKAMAASAFEGYITVHPSWMPELSPAAVPVDTTLPSRFKEVIDDASAATRVFHPASFERAKGVVAAEDVDLTRRLIYRQAADVRIKQGARLTTAVREYLRARHRQNHAAVTRESGQYCAAEREMARAQVRSDWCRRELTPRLAEVLRAHVVLVARSAAEIWGDAPSRRTLRRRLEDAWHALLAAVVGCRDAAWQAVTIQTATAVGRGTDPISEGESMSMYYSVLGVLDDAVKAGTESVGEVTDTVRGEIRDMHRLWGGLPTAYASAMQEVVQQVDGESQRLARHKVVTSHARVSGAQRETIRGLGEPELAGTDSYSYNFYTKLRSAMYRAFKRDLRDELARRMRRGLRVVNGDLDSDF